PGPGWLGRVRRCRQGLGGQLAGWGSVTRAARASAASGRPGATAPAGGPAVPAGVPRAGHPVTSLAAYRPAGSGGDDPPAPPRGSAGSGGDDPPAPPRGSAGSGGDDPPAPPRGI